MQKPLFKGSSWHGVNGSRRRITGRQKFRVFAVAKPQSTRQAKHKASATEVAKHKESASSDNTQNGAGPPAEDTAAVKKTSQTFVKLAVEEVPASEDEFIKTTRPPPVEERDAFIVQNTPALVDDDPTRFGLVDFLSSKDGPPRFIRPYLPGKSPPTTHKELPLMLYIPGIDGTGLAASRQFPSLVKDFDLRAMSIPGNDRTPFQALVRIVREYLEKEVAESPIERPVYVLGESFGGVLALAALADRADIADRLILVNPATSFPRSVWPRLGPLLPRVPKELYSSVPVLLAPWLGNPITLAAFGVRRNSSFSEQISQFQKGLQNLVPQLQTIAEILPPPTLKWKLDLLQEGSSFVEPLLKKVTQRTLLFVGDGDLLIPSKEEGPRLKERMPRCRLRVMEGRSHALLQEAGIDLPSLLREEGFYTKKKVMSAPTKKRTAFTFGTPASLELPTVKELELATDEALGWVKRLTSPVFFSTGEDGVVRQGLSGVQQRRPMLFVGNHQTYALDIGPLVEALIKERGIFPRGLAHPAIWAQQTPPGVPGPPRDSPDDDPGQGAFAGFMGTYGAVPVGGRNFFKLMQNGEAALLYPGGVREAYKNKNEKYKVLWPEREEFVRMAARFGATIVPVAAIGCEDAVTMLADARDIKRIPILGDRVARNARETIPQARRGASATTGVEEFIAPFSVPTYIPRFYYIFQKPIHLSKADLDKEGRCQEVYNEVRSQVEGGIQWLKDNRERDPYKDPLPRLLYEASWGGKQAPTFKV